MTSHQVIHNKQENRFEVHGEGHMAELVYSRSDDQIVFIRTTVPPELEGQGIGSALARSGLDYARDAGLAVVAQCSFVRGYIERHSEYQDLVQE